MYMEIHLIQMFITLIIAEINGIMATMMEYAWVVCAANVHIV